MKKGILLLQNKLIISLVLLTTFSAHGQIGGINAEFAGGGARALAMGGAFIALADDATAVEFNPAGLWNLRRPEVAFQAVYTHDKRETPLLELDPPEINTFFKDDTDSYIIPSFASFVYPTQHFVLGLSEFTNVYYDRSYALLYSDTEVDEKAENYTFGLTLATQLIDRLSIGGTVRYNKFKFSSRVDSPSGISRREFESESPSVNLGVLWRPHRYFSFGAVYKSSQPLDGTYRIRDGAGNDISIDTELPSTFGLGLAFHPNQDWRILFDVDKIWWSDFYTDPEYKRKDVYRFHSGMEWYAGHLGDMGIFFRGGYMYEESNAIKYKGDNEYMREFTSHRDPIQHYTFGIGFARPKYQIDLGMDLTNDNGNDFIASMVMYF